MIKFDGFPKHPRFFQKRIKEQEIFSKYPYKTQNYEEEIKKSVKSKEINTRSYSNLSNNKPWNYITTYSNYFDEMSVYRKTQQNTKLEKIPIKQKNKVLWENFTHPNEFFVKNDIDEWDFKIKRQEKTLGVFVPNTKTGGFFDKTLKDYF